MLETKATKKVIFIRIYIEANDLQDGNNVASLFADRSFAHAPLVEKEVKRYWKIPDYVEVTATLAPKDKTEEIFETLVNQLGTGWEYGGSEDEKWAIWNPLDLNYFSIAETRWASIEVISE
jgi:hypothetical protein